MSYAIGDDVEIYDGDIPGWVPGVIEDIKADSPLGPIWVVKTAHQTGDLPTTYALPKDQSRWLRRPAS